MLKKRQPSLWVTTFPMSFADSRLLLLGKDYCVAKNLNPITL